MALRARDLSYVDARYLGLTPPDDAQGVLQEIDSGLDGEGDS